MCSVLDSDLGDEEKFMEPISSNNPINSNCLKCATDKTEVILRGKDAYCTPCFQAAIEHKFRAALGKLRLIRHGEHVLIVHNGGTAVSTMLHIINQGLNKPTLHKQFAFKTSILYVENGVLFKEHIDKRIDKLRKLYDDIKSYNFPVYITTMADAITTNESDGNQKFQQLTSVLENPHGFFKNLNDGPIKNLISAVKTLTAKQDLVNTLQRTLVLRIATDLDCKFVFTSEIAPEIASKTLSTFALGRGNHVTMEVGFVDSRDPKVTIIRPMRDFTTEEVDLFCQINQLKSCEKQHDLRKLGDEYSSISNLTDNFIDDLQKNFPATIFTVLRTSEKLALSNKNENGLNLKCKICKSLIDSNIRNRQLSALHAVAVSKIASNQTAEMLAVKNMEQLQISDDCKDNEICHGCQLTLKDIEGIKEFLL